MRTNLRLPLQKLLTVTGEIRAPSGLSLSDNPACRRAADLAARGAPLEDLREAARELTSEVYNGPWWYRGEPAGKSVPGLRELSVALCLSFVEEKLPELAAEPDQADAI